MASRERVVEFAVKARDEYSKVLKNLEQQQTKLSAAAQASQRRATLGFAQSEVDNALANYKRLTADVERYNEALANGRRTFTLADAELEELASTIKLTRDRAREAADAYQQKRAALLELSNTAKVGYGAFNRLATSMEQGTTAATEESAAVAAEVTHLKKLETASIAAGNAQGILKKKTDSATTSLRNQSKKSGAKGEAQDILIYGLKPWQLTNLGYQVNDVISGIAQGQKLSQIAAQQAGQFAQIWPQAMVLVARSIPQIAAAAAVMAPFIAAAIRLHEVGASVRYFSQELAISADGAKYDAEALAKVVEQMGKLGIAADDARKIVSDFVKTGISEKDFLPLAKMAEQLSKLNGGSVIDNAAKLSKAFGGTIDDVRALDKELNFLSESQLRTIYSMQKQGDAAGGVAYAFSIFQEKMASVKQDTGPLSEAITSLGSAWDHLVNIVSRSLEFRAMVAYMNLLAVAAKKAAGAVDTLLGAVDRTATDRASTTIARDTQRIKELQDFIQTQKALGDDTGVLDAKNRIADYEAEIRSMRSIVGSRRDELEAIKDASAAQAESRTLTEADKKDRLDIQEVIDKQVKSLADETKQAQLTNRERFIEQELLKAKNAALERAKALNQDILGLTQDQADAVRRAAGAQYDAAHPNYEAQYTAQRGTAAGKDMAALVTAVTVLADQMHIDSKDLLTAISFETKGTFNPQIMGGAGGQYFGLSQFSPANQKKYGIGPGSTIDQQIQAMGKYLVDAGVKAGDGLLQIYAAINAGNASKVNASDAGNGGTPGTVLDKVSEQMDQHKAKAEGVLAAYAGIAEQAKQTAEYEKGFTDRYNTAKAELDVKREQTKEAYVQKAIQDEEIKARKAGVQLTDEQIQKLKQVAGATFDQQHANDEVNRLVAQRTALFESLQIAQQAGDQGKVVSVVGQIGTVEDQLKGAIEKAILFWQTMGGAGTDQAIANLQNLQDSIGQTLTKIDRQFLPSAEQLNEQLADTGANAFDAWAQALANSENATQAFFSALQQSIAQFLIDIGKAIIKQALFNALSGGADAGGSGGIGGAIVQGISALFRHGGGLASGSGRRATFSPALFANAERYHGGGGPMLGHNEVPVILEQDEEVLTRQDPRHVLNGGKSRGGTPLNVKNVNVFDPADILEAALSSVPGERILLNYMTRNSRKISSALGS